MTVDVLWLAQPMPLIAKQIGTAFRVYKAFEAPDRDAFIREVAPRIRAICAGGGHSRIDRQLIDTLPKLELVSSFGVGYDNIDAAYAGSKGVVVTNTPDVLNEEVADTALGLLLCTVRQLPQADAYVRAGKWLDKPFPLTRTLHGRSVGILGLGRIGKVIARRLEAFGLSIAYHGRNQQPDVGYEYHPTLMGMASAVDILMIVAPGGPSTNGIVNAEVLKALGPDGIVINVGRGTVVDERALIEALSSGTILSAGLDVFADEPKVPAELIAMPHVVLLPHVGSGTVHTRNAMGQLVVDNMLAWFAGKPSLTPVAETPDPRA